MRLLANVHGVCVHGSACTQGFLGRIHREAAVPGMGSVCCRVLVVRPVGSVGWSLFDLARFTLVLVLV